jgi:hypothetical protein
VVKLPSLKPDAQTDGTVNAAGIQISKNKTTDRLEIGDIYEFYAQRESIKGSHVRPKV